MLEILESKHPNEHQMAAHEQYPLDPSANLLAKLLEAGHDCV